MKLIAITYEQARLSYFKEQLAYANRRLGWAIKHNRPHYELEDRGREASYCADNVDMLKGADDEDN